MFRNAMPTIVFGLLVGLFPAVARAEDSARVEEGAKGSFYAREIQPILARHCYACHGPEKRKSGLRLDRKADALAGGDLGPAIVPGQPVESELLFRVTTDDPTLAMPPKGDRLNRAEIEHLREWIAGGADWPEDTDAAHASASPIQSDHWAFQPLTRPALPEVRDPSWPRNAIDRFLLARLESEGVAPSPEADRATLIRRLSLDLLGLPPSPADVAAFQADERPDAFERLVDRLLESPQFGERWGRYWLDLARYADSDGYEKDNARPFAYRYRDWVIDAINRDLPFDQFTTEQLAGDLLPDATLAQKTATGFHRNTLTNTEGGVDREEFRVLAVIDRVNTTGTVWLGLTIGCAQCHSHKYDPITQREYYGLFAFFNTSREIDLPAPLPGNPATTEAKPDPKKPVPHVRTIAENLDPPTSHILIRGDFLRPGEEVQPHTLAVLPPLQARGDTPDRLDLAHWLTDPANPLPARVAANRIWGHLFGRPLVATPGDFGTRGERPSHPELLDWLACEFRELGWSRKALIRRIVTSAAYRQSSESRPELVDRDPLNVWLARQNRFRVEAEIIRDLSLATSGLLASRIGGPSVRPPQPPGIAELTYAGSAHWVESRGDDRYRRGLYTWFQRTSPYPMLLTFDAPDANTCAVNRERSNTPLQALTLLNDAVFVECARAFACRLVHEVPDGSPADRIERAYQLGLSRSPDSEESAMLLRLFHEARDAFRSDPKAALAFAGSEPLPGIEPADLAAWTVVARTILNLDEFVTRE